MMPDAPASASKSNGEQVSLLTVTFHVLTNRSVSERLFQRRAQLIAGGFHAVDPILLGLVARHKAVDGVEPDAAGIEALDGLSGGKAAQCGLRAVS